MLVPCQSPCYRPVDFPTDLLMTPILLPISSVNHNAPSQGVVIPAGEDFGSGKGYPVIDPLGVMRPICPRIFRRHSWP